VREPVLRPEDADVERVATALGSRPVAWEPVERGMQTAAGRFIATTEDGRRAFVKIGWTLDTASWIRDEHLFYARTRGRPFLPALVGWDDDGERPVLALEDLSDARWPPPWDPRGVEQVLACLAEVAATSPPPDLPTARNSQWGLDGWPEVARDPSPFLSLGLCSRSWLDRSLPALADASRRARFDGDALLHFDVRSDNLCLHRDRAILVDWNFACVGNAAFDVAAWLPSLHAEGGPRPEAILPTTDEVAAIASLLAGNFAARAPRPPIPEAPHVRQLQRAQLATALPWAARALELPPPA
jgi:phosphotransferase family enzyme